MKNHLMDLIILEVNKLHNQGNYTHPIYDLISFCQILLITRPNCRE